MRTQRVLNTFEPPPAQGPSWAVPGGFRLHARGHGRAFTLVEILISLSILVVLVAIAAPRWGAASARYRADALARRIAADIERTRHLAVTRSAAAALKFDTGNNTYTVSGLESLDKSSADTTVNVAESPFYAALERATFGGTANLAFNGFGLPLAYGDLIIAVGNERRRVAVAPETGIVTIYRVVPLADGSTLGSTTFEVLRSVVRPAGNVLADVSGDLELLD